MKNVRIGCCLSMSVTNCHLLLGALAFCEVGFAELTSIIFNLVLHNRNSLYFSSKICVQSKSNTTHYCLVGTIVTAAANLLIELNIKIVQKPLHLHTVTFST